MSRLAQEQPPEINSFRVARDVISPEDLFSRLSVQNILAELEGTNELEEPDVSLITPGQSSRAMRGGPTLARLFRIYDELAEVVNELNSENPKLEGNLGPPRLMGKVNAPPGVRRYGVLTFSEELNRQLVSDENRLRNAVGLRIPESNISHATAFRVYDELDAQLALEGLTRAFESREGVVLGSVYIEPVFLRGENFALR